MTVATGGRKTADRGIALLMVLWIIIVLMVIVFSFSALARTETYSALSFREITENKNLAEAGIERGILEIIYRKQKPLDISQETWKTDGSEYTVDMGNGKATIRVIDESGKIDINMLTDASGIILKNLLLLRGVSDGDADTIVDSLLDWRDSNDSDAHRMHGAESDYYETLPVPYAAKNANFDTVEELQLVKGMTADVLFGTREKKGIDRLLTVHAYTDKINVNAAPRDVLAALPGIGPELADTIVSERQNRPAPLTIADVQSLLGPGYASASPYLSATESSTFTIESSGFREKEQSAYRIRATINFSQDFGSRRYLYYKAPVREMK